jgi:GT2 family glycosyltransferase
MHIVIPSSNPILARTCLESIEARDEVFLGRVVIITNDRAEFIPLQAEYPEVSVVEVAGAFNFAAWTNEGIRRFLPFAGSIMLLNDDTQLLTDGGLTALEALVESGGPPILSAAIRGTGGVIDQRQASPSGVRLMPGHISFTAVAIHRSAFERLGLLDERFVGYGYEDNDFCHRAIKAGMTIGVYDGCVMAHYKPHSSFARRRDFRDAWLLDETLFWEKWSEPQEAVVVIGGMRSGAAVVSAVIDKMGYDVPDRPASFEKKVSEYYRDDKLSYAVHKGEMGIRNYIAGRNYLVEDMWGTRIWPQPDMAIAFLERLEAQPLKLIFVERSRAARLQSYVNAAGMKHKDAATRIDAEIEGQDRIYEWAVAQGIPYHVVHYDALALFTKVTVKELAAFLGYEKSIATAVDVVRPAYRTFNSSGDLVTHDPPRNFGKVAVGVRLSHPEAAFVGCWTRLIRDGLRDGDEVLEPATRMPSHWAASTIMRRFLASSCDTLLMVDDDMTFDADLLARMRDNTDNWRHGVVSALATQRVPPPRALVMRIGEQPPLPDSLNGIYYDLQVDTVRDGETMPVDGTGFAFTLIRREVIEAMTDPDHGVAFSYYVRWGEGGEGEDINFCRRAGSLGYSVAVDAGAHVGHIGSVVYGYEEFNQWRASRAGTGLRADRLVELVEEAFPHLGEANRDLATSFLKSVREQNGKV